MADYYTIVHHPTTDKEYEIEVAHDPLSVEGAYWFMSGSRLAAIERHLKTGNWKTLREAKRDINRAIFRSRWAWNGRWHRSD